MPVASGLKAEIEFTAAVWTDVTADLDWGTGWTIRIGRSAPQDQIGPGSLTFTLRNPKGKYTPSVAVLSDGTAAPYYPNITRRKRVRVSNSAGVRFLGYISSWSPTLVNGIAGYTQVVAVDRLALLGRVQMAAGIQTEILTDQPVAYWPLTDPVGSKQAVDASGVNSIPLTIGNGGGTALAFGQDGPGVEQGTGVRFNTGQTLGGSANGTLSGVATIEGFVRLANSPEPGTFPLFNLGGYHMYTAGGGTVFLASGAGDGPGIDDGGWHHLVGVVNGSTTKLYVDGILRSTDTQTGTLNLTVSVGDVSMSGWAGHIAVYNYELTAARILAHANVAAQSQESVSDKVKRFLTYAGLTSSDWNVDTSTVITGTYPQDGKDVASACQDMATTEGAGSACYVFAGIVQFDNRAARKPTTPTLTVHAVHDLDNSVYQPSLDDLTLVNQAQVSRSTESGSQSTLTAYNAASIAAEGLTTKQVNSYANTDLDALNLAQDIVASGSNPGFRLPSLSLDLTTAVNNLYAAVQSTVIGSRIRVTNLPAGQTPATQVDVLAEGWTETANINKYQIVYDTSPADSPARMVLDDTTYGRLQAQADCALNAALTNVATTVVIKSPTLPTFTTVAARYPLKIVVGAEIIQLNSAPGGAVSPQTFTGCTRGVNGTTAAAHLSGALVQLWPTVGLTL